MQGFRRAVFILNPAARRLPSPKRLAADVESVCRELRLDPAFHVTDAPGHATQLAAEAEAAGADLIFACGGDGTLNEVLNGVSRRDLAIGVIPGGTVDVWAREAGVPRPPRAALRAQVGGSAIALDVGRAGARRFLLMASLGLDAAAVAAVRPRLKRRLGSLAYGLAGLEVGLRAPRYRVRLQFDDGPPEDVEALMLLFGNTRLYGGFARIAAEASAVDGMLDCVIFRGHGLPRLLSMLPVVLSRRHLRSRHVLFRRARSVTVQGDPLPLQIDGDAVGRSESRFTVEPRAARLLVPRPQRPLFQDPR